MKTFKLTYLVLFIHLFYAGNYLASAQSVDSFDIGYGFIPAGYMGCNFSINLDPAWRNNPKSSPLCFKVSYTRTCTKKWAGVYWTNTATDTSANWGQLPCTDLSKGGYTKITFWARGETGGEVVEFGAFGIDNTYKNRDFYLYKDSCPKTVTKGRIVVLEPYWKQYSIIFQPRCKDLSCVIGGFYWSSNWESNPSGLIFYLDDIMMN